jgi:ribosomal protein L32
MTLPKYPTCPNCGTKVIKEHLDVGHEVCIYCGPTRDLDTYGELERERFLAWQCQYEDDQLDKVK